MTTVEDRRADDVADVERITRAARARKGPPTRHVGRLALRGGGGFRTDVEGLRAVAVLLVVLFHADVPGIAGGYVGVDVFFVISGYLITRQLLDELRHTGRIRITAFYARRALRLLPAATFVATATLAAAWLWMPALRFRQIAGDAIATTYYGLNYRLAAQGTDYLASTAPPSPFQHYWSLAVEEQFYLVWPALIVATVWLARRRRSGSTTGPIITLLVAVIVASLAVSVYVTAHNAPWAYFGAHTRAFELAAGGLVTVAAPWLTTMPRVLAIAARWAGFAGLAYAILTFTQKTQFPGYAAALPVAATALVIASGCREPGVRLLDAAPIQLIGRLSYPWYLWHWPVLTIAPFVFGQLSIVERLSLAGISFLLAYITSIKIEQPVMDRPWLRRQPVHGLTMGLSLCGGLAAAALIVPLVLAPTTTGTGRAVNTADRIGTSTAERDLTALIASSALVNRVPANLTPSLIRADVDVARIYRDGCGPALTSSAVEKPCIYGDRTSKTTVVLFGDSHAGHWFPAVDAIATRRHWRLAVVTKSACSVASVLVYMQPLNRPYTECPQWREKALAYITSLHPAMIIASSNGHGDALNMKGDKDVEWAKAWTTTFNRFPASAKLVLISDTAWPAGSVPDCVSAHLDSLTACDRPRTAALADRRRRALVASAARARGATVIDPGNWMCTPTVCPVIIGNVLVYKDDSHMSATFSKLLAPVLGPYLPTLR